MAIIENVGRTKRKLFTEDIELAVSKYFNPRANLIVPNVYWSFFRHECDLFVLTKAGYGYEIEIKITLSDLRNDSKKLHNHNDKKLKYLFFAIPERLEKHIELIPERAGILKVWEENYIGYKIKNGYYTTEQTIKTRTVIKKIREPKINGNYKFNKAERFEFARLGALRIWGLKEKIVRQKIKESCQNNSQQLKASTDPK